MGKNLKGKELGKGITQRKDGRYEARFTLNGKNICLYNMNLSKLKKDFENEKLKILRDETGLRPNVKVSEWYDEWFDKCKSPMLKSDLTRNNYNRRMKRTFIRLFGDKKLTDLMQLNIQMATNQLLEEKYSVRYIKESLSTLKECLDSAVVNKIISVNPCIDIKIKESPVIKEKRVLDHWEQELFIDEIKHSYYYEAYMILLLTGMRIGEFSGLQWGDVDFDNKVINIRRTLSTGYFNGRKVEEMLPPKSQMAYRSIPFFDNAESLLMDWKAKQDLYKKQLGNRWRAKPELGDLVFTSTMGSPVSRYVLVHDLEKVIDNINLKEVSKAYRENRPPRTFKHIHPHAFRHTFATRCFENGLDPLFVQSIMGHSNYSTTIGYTHVLDNIKHREVAKVTNFLSAKVCK